MLKITAQGNNEAEILLYDVISDFDSENWGVVSAKGLINKVKALGDVKNITLRINSYGGDVFQALAIYNYLKSYKANVTVKIDGIAASAASVIAMAGDKIIMPENAFMMIHNPAGGVYGNAEDMREHAEVLDTIRDSMANIYIARTGIDREKLIAMLDAETWMSANEAHDMKFCDEVSEALQVAAKADVRGIKAQLLFNPKVNAQVKAQDKKEEAISMPEKIINSADDLTREYPDFVNQIVNSAVTGERERLRVLDSLNAPGREEIIAKAKYEEPKDARDIAIELLQADKNRATLSAMNADAQAVDAALTPQVTATSSQEESERTAALIAKHINNMRGFQ